MYRLLLTAGLSLLASAALGAAGTPCEEVKAQIAAKLEANGVREYQLEIANPGGAAGWQAVGRCEAGTKEILYRRGLPEQPEPLPEEDALPEDGPATDSVPPAEETLND